MSQLVFLFAVLPNPSDNFLKELNRVLFNFIWGGKTDKIRRTIITKSYEQGGLNIVNVFDFLKGMKIFWIKRYMTSLQVPGKFYSTTYSGRLGKIVRCLLIILCCGVDNQ